MIPRSLCLEGNPVSEWSTKVRALPLFSGTWSLYIPSGMAGNQVLEWADFDTEIKTAGVKNVRTLSLWLSWYLLNHSFVGCAGTT